MIQDIGIQLPQNIYFSKKHVTKCIFISAAGLIVAFSTLLVATGGASGAVRYPLAAVVSVFAILLLSYLLVKDIVRLIRHQPVATLSEQGVKVYESPYNALGIIRWKDIEAFREIAFSNVYNLHGRKLCFVVDDLMNYIKKITDKEKRKKVLKEFTRKGNCVFCINVNELNCDPKILKRIITGLMKNARQPVG